MGQGELEVTKGTLFNLLAHLSDDDKVEMLCLSPGYWQFTQGLLLKYPPGTKDNTGYVVIRSAETPTEPRRPRRSP